MLASCADPSGAEVAGKDSSATQRGSTPTITIRLTDKPLEADGVEAVLVEIDRVDVAFEDSDEPLTVVDEPGTFDLFELRDGVTTTLGVSELPVGVLGQLRLVLRSASIVVRGETRPLVVPSGTQTGVKIPLDALVVDDKCEVDILLDFDAEQSVIRTGHGGFKLRPVVQVSELITDCDPSPRPPRVVAIVQYEAPRFGDAAQELSRLVGGTPEYQAALADVTATLRPTLVVEALNEHCSDGPTFANFMPVAQCQIDEDAIPSLRDALHPEGSVIGVHDVDADSGVTTHEASDEALSFSFRNMDINDDLGETDGSGMRIGVIELTSCDESGQPRQVDDRDAALDEARVTHLNPSSWEPTFDEPLPHMHAVVTSMTHLDRATGERDVVPRAAFFVGNMVEGGGVTGTQCTGTPRSQLISVLDFFVENGVRLINRSTLKVRPDPNVADCDAPLFESEILLDRYARTYDWVVTAAAGQEEEGSPLCPVLCDALNQICVGGARDVDHSTVGGSGDLTDDRWAGGIDSLTFFFEDPEELDREEPDVVAPARNVVVSNPFDRTNVALPGTSLASPLVLALNGKQLEVITANGPHPWQRCRVSEFIRAATKFSAGEHPVLSDGHRRRVAPHDLLNSGGGPQGIGEVCFEPSHCARGLTCLFGQCADNPGDEIVGWGLASVNDSVIAGDWGCFGLDDGTGRQCGLSNDGTCGRPRTHGLEEDPLDIPGVLRRPEAPPSGVGVAINGRFLQSGSFREGEVYRGVYSWSSCPAISQEPCDTASDCPERHACFMFRENGTCDSTVGLKNRRKIPAVDFNVAVYDFQIDRWTWLSYSQDDNLEAFEYVFPRTGSYLFMSFADRDDWGCDESVWGATNIDHEWDAYVGGAPRWLQP